MTVTLADEAARADARLEQRIRRALRRDDQALRTHRAESALYIVDLTNNAIVAGPYGSLAEVERAIWGT